MANKLKGTSCNAQLKQNLRIAMTEPERRLWLRLKSRQIENLKIRRQHGIGPYIVDFYCPDKSVVIEIDGDTHSEEIQIIRDAEREKYLKSLGLKIIRYTNDEVMKNIDGVLSDLMDELSTSPFPSLQRRGDG